MTRHGSPSKRGRDRTLAPRRTAVAFVLASVGSAGCTRTAPSSRPVGDAGVEAYSFAPFFDCADLRVDDLFPVEVPSGSSSDVAGRNVPSPPLRRATVRWEDEGAFVGPMVASVSLDPASKDGAAVVAAVLRRGPPLVKSSREYRDPPPPFRPFLTVPLEAVTRRIARARVFFTVTSDGTVDRVSVGLVDRPSDGGLGDGASSALRLLASMTCAFGPFRGVPAGTCVSYAFDRDAAWFDAGGATGDDGREPSRVRFRSRVRGPTNSMLRSRPGGSKFAPAR